VYGVSLWLLWLNVAIYFLSRKVIAHGWGLLSKQTITASLLIVLLYLLPGLYGGSVLRNVPPVALENQGVKVGVIQPNIDPFGKWYDPPPAQVARMESLTTVAKQSGAVLAVWPETAIPLFVLEPRNEFILKSVRACVDTLRINLLTGMLDIVFYPTGTPAPKSSTLLEDGSRSDSYNSSIMLDPEDRTIQKYSKSHLVPYAERVPYSEFLSFLNAMKWNLGLGGWGIGTDTTVFHFRDSNGRTVRFANLICYESIYPAYVAEFVKRGAQFLTVITNDSWWGITSGAYQHKQMGVLRAIENRRWLVQCGNGGISCFIDPYGRTVLETQLYTEGAFVSPIEPRTDLTFYTAHEDLVAYFSLLVSAVFCVVALARKGR
jgi:apolipoprotein N-acyltransferase